MTDTIETGADGKPLYETEADLRRYELISPCVEDLIEMGRTVLFEKHYPPEDVVLLCISVCDRWQDLLDMLTLEEGTDDLEDDRDDLVVMSAADESARTYLVAALPAYRSRMHAAVPAGHIRLIALDRLGCSVYDLDLQGLRTQ